MLADIVVFDGLDELDALGPYEILRRAGQLSIDFSVRLVTTLVNARCVRRVG